jgi:hypothetical protein
LITSGGFVGAGRDGSIFGIEGCTGLTSTILGLGLGEERFGSLGSADLGAKVCGGDFCVGTLDGGATSRCLGAGLADLVGGFAGAVELFAGGVVTSERFAGTAVEGVTVRAGGAAWGEEVLGAGRASGVRGAGTDAGGVCGVDLSSFLAGGSSPTAAPTHTAIARMSAV